MAHPLIALTILLAAGAALAREDDSLPDPTRPPAAVTKAIEEAARETAPSPVVLQSIIRRAGARPAAIIGGERVELGGEYAGARLVKIAEQEVVLEGPGGRETLRLTPAVEKKPVAVPAAPRRVQRTMRPGKEGL